MQVYSYAEEMASTRRLRPKQDLVSVLLNAEVEGEKLDQLELDLFFLLLIVAGNETTRNLMSGAMTAFLTGKIKVDGDITKLIALQSAGASAATNSAAREMAGRLQAMTA